MNDTASTRRRLWRHTPMRDLVRGRITGRLDIDRLLDESGLPEEAGERVRQVVRRTRLWRLEKVDVANELIAHFLDGLEAQTPLDELLETFGDDKQTARLIRRAKKRQRPLVWHAMRWTGWTFVSLVGFYMLLAGYFFMGSPQVKVNYLNQLNAQALAVPEDQRAWPLYREALLQLNIYGENKETSDLIPEHGSPGSPRWDETVAYLHQHDKALALIRQGAARPGLGFVTGFASDFDEKDRQALNITEDTVEPDYGILIAVSLPHLGPIRAMTRLLVADAHLATIESDPDRVYADITAMLGLAHHSDEIPTLISRLVGISIRETTFALFNDLLVNHPHLFSDEQLHMLAHRIAALDDPLNDGLDGERMMFYDLIQRIYTDDGHGDGRITPEGLRMLQGAVALGPAAMTVIASRKELVDKYQQLMDATEAEYHQPLWADPGSRVDKEIVSWSNLQRARYIPIYILMPATSAGRKAIETERGYRDGVLVGIALELYRRQHGDWPSTLGELVPAYLPSVPVDRLTGQPVKYRVTDDGPVVYSLGVDGDDDGGRLPEGENPRKANRQASPPNYHRKRLNPTDGDWRVWPIPRNVAREE